jgi:type IV secretory pathway VirB10-like protein
MTSENAPAAAGGVCASEGRQTLAQRGTSYEIVVRRGVRVLQSRIQVIERWASAFCLALLMGGCAKRQSGVRLVYVAPPPTSTPAASTEESGTLVIEAPPPPEPEQPQPAALPPPASAPKAEQVKPRQSGQTSAQAPAEQQLVEPPPIEPANNPGQGQRQQLEKTQRDIGSSIEQLERSLHSNSERRTLAEARAFLDQSTRALKEGDLPLAEKLATKANLLITALKPR